VSAPLYFPNPRFVSSSSREKEEEGLREYDRACIVRFLLVKKRGEGGGKRGKTKETPGPECFRILGREKKKGKGKKGEKGANVRSG